MRTLILFAMCAINIPFIIMETKTSPLNWAAAVFCFGLGIASAIKGV